MNLSSGTQISRKRTRRGTPVFGTCLPGFLTRTLSRCSALGSVVSCDCKTLPICAASVALSRRSNTLFVSKLSFGAKRHRAQPKTLLRACERLARRSLLARARRRAIERTCMYRTAQRGSTVWLPLFALGVDHLQVFDKCVDKMHMRGRMIRRRRG